MEYLVFVIILFAGLMYFLSTMYEENSSPKNEDLDKYRKFDYSIDRDFLYWIDEQIAYLISSIGHVRPKKFFVFNDNHQFYESLSASIKSGHFDYGRTYLSGKEYKGIRQAIRKIRKHLGIEKAPLIKCMTKKNNINKNSVAYIIKESDKIVIYINFSKIYNAEQLAAVLCHEFTHYYLNEHFIYKDNKIENEKFTDLVSCYLGFGKVILKGYTPYIDTEVSYDKSYMKKSVSRVGYLSAEEIADIYVRLCYFYKISNDNYTEDLNNRLKTLVTTKYKTNKKFYTSFDDESKKIKMCCKHCKRKLRFPVLMKDLKIKCPFCRTINIVYSRLFIFFNKNNNVVIAPKINHNIFKDNSG